jgi:polyhydroxybutyrate depolymerase
VGGTSRTYYLVPPTNYNPATAYPLVFVFHGAGGTGENIHGWFKLEQAASGAALFVYPDGLGGIWDLGNNGPDAKLFDQVVASLSEQWCLDSKAIFAAGFSYGGWAATQMALARPTVVRAIASIAGGGPQGGKKTDPAVAAMIIHGTADTAEPIVAGTKSRDHFAATNGCTNGTSSLSPSPCVAYAGCQPGKSVAWCEHAGAHEIPEFAASGIWSFFLANR